MQDIDFTEIVNQIHKENPRFDKKAYFFIRHGLDHTVKTLKKKSSERAAVPHHVTGQELVEGLRQYALDQYGPLAKTVLNSWGVEECTHFGEIVYELIEYNVFSKTEEDRREDFANLYTFDDAFVAPFLPSSRRHPPATPRAESS